MCKKGEKLTLVENLNQFQKPNFSILDCKIAYFIICQFERNNRPRENAAENQIQEQQASLSDRLTKDDMGAGRIRG